MTTNHFSTYKKSIYTEDSFKTNLLFCYMNLASAQKKKQSPWLNFISFQFSVQIMFSHLK